MVLELWQKTKHFEHLIKSNVQIDLQMGWVYTSQYRFIVTYKLYFCYQFLICYKMVWILFVFNDLMSYTIFWMDVGKTAHTHLIDSPGEICTARHHSRIIKRTFDQMYLYYCLDFDLLMSL